VKTLKTMTQRRTGADTEERAALRSRKRFARRQWRRRWLAWRYLLVALLVVALVGGGTWLVYFSSVLTVKRVDVEGVHLLSRQQVLRTARVPAGEQLARLDVGAIAARVRSLAAVRSADVSRKWPDGVRIVIEERVAVAVIEIGGRLRGLDAEGVVFNEYAKPPPGLPRISPTSSTTPEALREAAIVVSAFPKELAAMVDHVEVKTVDQITLVLKDERIVIWGSSDDSATKAEVLLQLLRQPAKVYDVSVPGQPTTCPEASAQACLRQP
jgi:cell division protein FtsQ